MQDAFGNRRWIMALAILLGGFTGASWSGALPPSVLDHGASIRADNALIAEVEVRLSRPGRVFVEYENPQAGKFRTALSEERAEHVIPVVRLRAETAYSYAIGVQDAGGAVHLGPRGEFRTGSLPANLATLRARVRGRSSQPLILTNYTAEHDQHGDYTSYILFRDEAGEIVWHYFHGPPKEFMHRRGRVHAIKQKPGGNLVYVGGWCCIVEISPQGEVLNRLFASEEAGSPHHDFVLLDDGRILYLSDEKTLFDDSANGGEAKTSAIADALRIWDPERGRVEQVWDSRDFWDIASADQRDLWEREDGAFRWTHINSASFGPRGNLILSSRHRQQILSLAADFQTIEWQLGGPGSDYRFPNPSDRFYVQHQATELPNGNILLFDNGHLRPASEGGEYSRAIEIRLDGERRSAAKAWEHRADPDIFSEVVSGVARLGNGNTLINFGVRKRPDDQPLTVLEVDPQGNELFRIETLQLDRHPDPRDGQFRPLRFRAIGGIGSIMGETMLRAPAARPRTEAFIPDDQQYWKAAKQQQRQQRLNRYRLLHESLASGDLDASLVRAAFDIHLGGRALTYFKRPCDADDTRAVFFLHVFPVDKSDLPPSRRPFGFNKLGFRFAWSGEFLNGGCIAQRLLPDYPIKRIRTGQYVLGERQLWQAKLLADMPPAGRAGQGSFSLQQRIEDDMPAGWPR